MLDEILRSIRAYLYERVTSPLIGSFVIAWCGWNYQFVLVIFSSLAVTEKITFIETVLFPTWIEITGSGLLFPILTSLGYIFIYPYLSKPIFIFHKNRQRELAEIKQKIEDETLLTVKQSREIKVRIHTLEKEYQTELANKDSEIQQLKDEIKPLDNATKSSEEHINLNKTQVSMLKIIGEKADGLLYGEIMNKFTSSVSGDVRLAHYLAEMEQFGYVEIFPNGHGEKCRITKEGLEYLVQNKYV